MLGLGAVALEFCVDVTVEDTAGVVLALPQEAGVLLVRWVQAPSEREILGHLESLRLDDEPGPAATIEARPGPLLLFDSACPGYEVEDDKLVIDLHPGQYLAYLTECNPDEETSLILIRLTRVA